MMKHVLALSAAAATLLAALPAAASHVFFSNVQINGVVLEDASGFTNPLFNLNVGDTLTFSANVSGQPDTLNANLTGFAGVSPDPFAISYSGGGATVSQTLTFNSIGNFLGNIAVNLSSSTPDYRVPATNAQVDGRTFAFRVNVGSAAVPEPATWVFMIMGFGSAGAMIRQRRRAMA